jgi:hypothetical protein
MTKFQIKLPVAVSVLTIVLVVSIGFFNEAKAKCTNKCQTGYLACLNWCSANNGNFTPGLGRCSIGCQKYWDSGKNPQSIGRSDPSYHPPRKVGPGKLKNPPTTVSNPNAPTKPPAQIREKKK